MDDLISRKMAIDKMQMFIDSLDKEATAYKYLRVAFNRCIIELKRLPSAQPEVLSCGSGELVQESDSLVKDLVKDCISRKMAIDKMQMFIGSLDKEATAYKSLRVAFNRCIIELKRMPPAQPERKKGRWILVSDGYTDCVKCDKCGEVLDVEKNFCPSCGADMRGEK